jgi:hypothetical protein
MPQPLERLVTVVGLARESCASSGRVLRVLTTARTRTGRLDRVTA